MTQLPELAERTLDLWASGTPRSEIERMLDLTRDRVRYIVERARRAGDQRALGRTKPPRHAPAVIDDVLDRWASGQDSGQIGRALGLKPGTVKSLVRIARAKGDQRAMERGRGGRVEQSGRKPKRPPAPPAGRSNGVLAKSPPANAIVIPERRIEPTRDEGSPSSGARLLTDLARGECRFPTEDRWDEAQRHRFCGRPVEPGYRYCPHHALRSYTFHDRLREKERLRQVCEALGPLA